MSCSGTHSETKFPFPEVTTESGREVVWGRQNFHHSCTAKTSVTPRDGRVTKSKTQKDVQSERWRKSTAMPPSLLCLFQQRRTLESGSHLLTTNAWGSFKRIRKKSSDNNFSAPDVAPSSPNRTASSHACLNNTYYREKSNSGCSLILKLEPIPRQHKARNTIE